MGSNKISAYYIFKLPVCPASALRRFSCEGLSFNRFFTAQCCLSQDTPLCVPSTHLKTWVIFTHLNDKNICESALCNSTTHYRTFYCITRRRLPEPLQRPLMLFGHTCTHVSSSQFLLEIATSEVYVMICLSLLKISLQFIGRMKCFITLSSFFTHHV